MNKVYYSQIDKRWSNYPYPSQALPHATIGSGGCGVCSCAMVISMLRKIVYPQEIADMFVRDGIRVNGGTSNKAYQYIADKYNLQTKRTTDYNELIDCLKRGGLALVGCGNGLFTNGAHIICIAGIEGDNFIIHDSYLYNNKFNVLGRNNRASIRGTEVLCTINNFKNYANAGGFWIYEPTGVDTNKDETGIEPAKVVIDRETVGTSKKLKQNCNLWGNADLTGTRYSYLKNTTVKVLENISNNVDKIYVPATGRTAYIDISNYTETATNQVTYKVMTVTAKSGLNVRAGAGTNSKIVTCYKYGTQVKVYSIENGWAKGTKGYMYSKYLK